MQNGIVETKVPQWLNEDFLKRAIRSYKRDDSVEVVKFSASPAFAEHYASKMFRVNLEFKSKRYAHTDNEVLSVVIKAQRSDVSELVPFVVEVPLFDTEIEMYEKVIPVMNQLYRRNEIKAAFAPELIYTTSEPFPIIVLQDLTPDDYKVWQAAPESIDDVKLIIQRLAQFHAASIYLTENNEYDFSHLNHSLYESDQIVEMFTRDTLRAFVEVLSSWEGCESYIPKVEKLITDIGEIGKKLYTANAKGCGFNVLNHGDFHMRNILIKANGEQHIESFNFIDYQCSAWCSPAVDLAYMMGLARLADATDLSKQELIVFYHRELVDALKSIGYMQSPPSLLDLNVELLKHGDMNIIMWTCFFPFLFIDWNTMALDDMMGTDSEKSRQFKVNLFKSPVLKQLLQKEMKSWTCKGWW